MLISQISVFVENKSGRLAYVTGLLAREKIDLRAFSMAESTDFGILRMIVNDPEKAVRVLREDGLTVNKTKVIGVRLPDVPGSLHSLLKILTEERIEVEYAYAFLTKNQNDAFVILRIDETDRALEAFKQANIQTLREEEAYAL